MTKKAIIIGSGIAGLALSVRLRLKKYEVHVFEKNDKFGGKLEEFRLGDYRYDFGPKLFTMPDYLVELFTISSKDVEDYICLLYTSPSPRDRTRSRMPSSA